MRFCVECGRRIEDGARFCGGCGAPLAPGNASGAARPRMDDGTVVSSYGTGSQAVPLPPRRPVTSSNPPGPVGVPLPQRNAASDRPPRGVTTFGDLAHEHRERDKADEAKSRERASAAAGQGARGSESYRRGASIGTNTSTADSGSFGWAVLGFFVPLVGLILYFVWKTERPSNAVRCRNGAIVGIAANIIFGLVIRAVTYAAVQNLNEQITSSQSSSQSSESANGTTGNDTSASDGSSSDGSGSGTSDDGSYGDPDDWRLSLDGFGPVRLGMSAAEAEATGGFKHMGACDVGALYWTGNGGTADDFDVIAWLDEQGTIWSISTDGTPTADGVTSSTTLSDLKSIYGNRLIKDSRPDSDTYVVNGSGAYLLFTINDDTGTVGHPNHVAELIEGNVTADTVPNAFSCKAAYRD